MLAWGAALIIALALLAPAGCSRPPALAGDGAVDAAREAPGWASHQALTAASQSAEV